MLMYIVSFVGGCRVNILIPEDHAENEIEDFAASVPELLENKTIQSIWMVPNFMDYLEDVR